jgi:hypothetical protein
MGEGLSFESDEERAAWRYFVEALGNPATIDGDTTRVVLRALLERWLGGVRELAMRNANQAMTIASLRDHANEQAHAIDQLRNRLAAVQGQRT